MNSNARQVLEDIMFEKAVAEFNELINGGAKSNLSGPLIIPAEYLPPLTLTTNNTNAQPQLFLSYEQTFNTRM